MLIGIFGTGRNGSSLLSRLLDGLQDTYVHPVEEKFFTAFNDLVIHGKVSRVVEQNCVSKKLTGLEDRLTVAQLDSYFKLSLKNLHKHCTEAIGLPNDLNVLQLQDILSGTNYSVDNFVRAYLANISSIIRPDLTFKHQLFKSIETPYIADYIDHFKDLKSIHIMRDPVAVCSSMKRSLLENKCVPASYLGYDWLSCVIDKRWVPHAKFLEKHRNDPRHILVRYEDLVVDPEKEVSRIAANLDLAPPVRKDIPTVFHNLDKVSWGDNPSKRGVTTPSRVESDLQGKNGYREVLSAREIDLISIKTGMWLNQLGYKCKSHATRGNVSVKYMVLDKSELQHCSSPRYWLRGLFGLIYRRIMIFI